MYICNDIERKPDLLSWFTAGEKACLRNAFSNSAPGKRTVYIRRYYLISIASP